MTLQEHIDLEETAAWRERNNAKVAHDRAQRALEDAAAAAADAGARLDAAMAHREIMRAAVAFVRVGVDPRTWRLAAVAVNGEYAAHVTTCDGLRPETYTLPNDAVPVHPDDRHLLLCFSSKETS